MIRLAYFATVAVALAFALAAPASAVQKKKAVACENSAFPGGGCPSGQFCQAPAGQCFITFFGGTCTLVPQVCLNNLQPVCGCDGKTYRNDCKRRQAKVSKIKDSAC
jgi:Kazal-type serine protease inhibitor domain